MTTCSLGLKGLRPDQLKAAFKFGKEYFLRTSKVDEKWEGSGIVICGGGRYLQWTLNNVRNIRRFDGTVPVEVWCLNEQEIPEKKVFSDLGVRVVNVQDVLMGNPMRKLGGWGLKHYAVLHSPFARVMFLDADCLCTSAGLKLFNHREFLDKGALMFLDCKRCHVSDLPYFSASIQPPRFCGSQEFESGQFLVDKTKCHAAVRMTNWLNEHQDAWWRECHGDKLSLELAFRGLKTPFGVGTCAWREWGIEHSFDGQWCFAHCLGTKRGKAGMPVVT